MVLYGSASATVGNLHYHAASILILQNQPEVVELQKSHKSVLWHARQICGIVAENRYSGTQAHAVSPLFIAGKVMHHDIERQAALDMLKDLQPSAGWQTAQVVTHLKQTWRNRQAV